MQNKGLPVEKTAPSVRTLALTEVLGRSKLTASLGDAEAQAVWAHHDGRTTELVAGFGGVPVIRTDGVLALFDSPEAAYGFAHAYLGALASFDPPLQGRIALHRGPLVVRPNTPEDVALGAKELEADGLALSLAARIRSIAQPGQILASALAVPQTEARVVAHGHWRMKGAPEPLEVFEVAEVPHPAPPRDAAKTYRVVRDGDAWRPARQIPHQIPAEWDTFVGRDADLRALSDLLDEARIVSVTAMGGSGKTRLVLHYAWTHLGEYPGGVWFCDLTEARDANDIVRLVATTLDVPLGQGDDAATVGNALAGRGPCLVVLDNFEQVARHGVTTVGPWAARASDATFLVTTREVMGLDDERPLALDPLAKDQAVALFEARAAAVKGDFRVGPDNRADVTALVGLLDHLPLAIELAAARARVMAPGMLLSRMTDRFRLLRTKGGRNARQATLQATLDWSWELLAPEEQGAMAALSVFEGGFTAEAAQAVLDLPPDRFEALAEELVAKSWLRRREENRYSFLLSVKDYAGSKLGAADQRALEERHLTWFAQLGTVESLTALVRHGGVERSRALGVEFDNLAAAFHRGVRQRDWSPSASVLYAIAAVCKKRGWLSMPTELGEPILHTNALSPPEQARLLVCLGEFWRINGDHERARDYATRALATDEVSGKLVLDAHGVLGRSALDTGGIDEARSRGEHMLELARGTGNSGDFEVGYEMLCAADMRAGRLTATSEHLESWLEIARDLGDAASEATGWAMLGIVTAAQGRPDEAEEYYERAIERYSSVGATPGVHTVMGNMANNRFRQGRVDEALDLLAQAARGHAEAGNRQGVARDTANLGYMLLSQDRFDEARAKLMEARELQRGTGEVRVLGAVLECLGRLHARQGEWDEARAAWDEGRAVFERTGEALMLANLYAARAMTTAPHDAEEAQHYLDLAIATTHGFEVSPQSPVGKAIQLARDAVAGQRA